MVGGGVDVQHQAHVVDVDAPRGDVGGDQHRCPAFLEVGEYAVALPLRLTAVQRARAHTARAQPGGEPVDVVLGAHEQDGAAVTRGDLGDHGLLVPLLDLEQVVVHRLDARRGPCDGVGHRIVQVGPHQLLDGLVEGRREQQALPTARGAVQEVAHLGQEAHVGHLVGLVESHHVGRVERAGALPQVVGQAARCGDEQVHTSVECLGLPLERHPPDGDAAPQAQRLRQRDERVGHLHGQLACRDEHQRPRLARGGLAAVEPGQHRQAEGQGLAGAGLGAAEHVAARERVGHGGGLDGEGFGQARVTQRTLQRRGQVQLGERNSGHSMPLGRGTSQGGPAARTGGPRGGVRWASPRTNPARSTRSTDEDSHGAAEVTLAGARPV